MKTIVLGLDGANWPLLEPWLESGDLPELATLRREATWGPLTSELPPVTSPNWRCYATGRNPGKLGVFWWETVDRERQTIRHPTARDFHTRPLWEELADARFHVAVINFPTGYPPAPIRNGRFTAGGPGARDTGFAYPAEWEAELRQRYGYRVHPTDVPRGAGHVAAHLDELLALLQSRFDVAFDLLAEGVDFLHVTLFYTNVLQHFCYRDEPTRAGWQLIDRNLGHLRRLAAEKGYNLLLVSDHGCAPVDTVFHVNTWLAREGYLKVRLPAVVQRLGRWGLERERLVGLARRWGLTPLLRRAVPETVRRAIPGADGTFDREAKAARVDWQRSVALAGGQGPVYLLLRPDDPDYERVREAIAASLTALRNPKTGQPVVTRVFRREEVYNGPFLDRAPDLIFEQGPGVHTSGRVGHPDVFSTPEKWRADNVVEGLFLAWGPDFAARGRVNGVRIVDLAPTILHLMGVAVPEDVDGRVLVECLAPESEAARRPITFRPGEDEAGRPYTPEEEAEIVARLTDLGYLE